MYNDNVENDSSSSHRMCGILTYSEIKELLPWKGFCENKDLSDEEIKHIFDNQDEAPFKLSMCRILWAKDQEYQKILSIYNKLAGVQQKIQKMVKGATTHEYFVQHGKVFKREIDCVTAIEGIMLFFSPVLKQPTMDIVWGKIPPTEIRRYHNADVLGVFDRLFRLMSTHDPRADTWKVLCDMLGFFSSMYQCSHFFWNESFYFELALSIFDDSIIMSNDYRTLRVLGTCDMLLDAIEKATSKRQLDTQCSDNIQIEKITKKQKIKE
jgi:hypothetical protein